MKSIYNYFIFVGIALFAISCADPVEPTHSAQVIGEWEVAQYYVSGQAAGTNVIERLIIERDGNFIMEDANGFLTNGTWAASETQLTLTPVEGEAVSLQIVTLTFEKAHMIQSINSPSIGEIQINYLLNNLGEGQYSN